MKDSEWIDEYGRRRCVAAGVVWYYMSNMMATGGDGFVMKYLFPSRNSRLAVPERFRDIFIY